MTVNPRCFAIAFLLAMAISLCTAHNVTAVPVTLLFDPDLSSISLGGDFSGIPLSEQAPGSSTTSLSGSISVDVDNRLAPTTIQILGSSAVAAVNGSWLPEAGGGPTPGDPGTPADGNYGLALDVGALGMAFAAAREIEFDVTSGVETVTAGSFASAQTLTLASGFFDVNFPIGPPVGSDPSRQDLSGDVLTNMAAAPSTYTVSGSTITLEIPIDIVDADDLTVVYSGRLVATVPEPTSALLMAAMLATLSAFLARSRKNPDPSSA